MTKCPLGRFSNCEYGCINFKNYIAVDMAISHPTHLKSKIVKVVYFFWRRRGGWGACGGGSSAFFLVVACARVVWREGGAIKFAAMYMQQFNRH